MISNDYMKDSNLQAQIAELANSVGSGAKIQTGSYVGTGTYGASNPCSLTFDFIPKVVIISSGVENVDNGDGTSTRSGLVILLHGQTQFAGVHSEYNYTQIGYNTVSWSENTITWYYASGGSSATLRPEAQRNANSTEYRYIVFG